METLKTVGIYALCAIVILGLIVALGFLDLGFSSYFSPKKEKIRREVFENTESFVDGKIQDLASYYEQYQKAKDPGDKETIRNVVRMKFAKFDAGLIDNSRLKDFLTTMRGF